MAGAHVVAAWADHLASQLPSPSLVQIHSLPVDDEQKRVTAGVIYTHPYPFWSSFVSVHHNSSSSKCSRVAASEEAILSLPEVPVTGRSRSGSVEECVVCLQDFRANETLRAMPCSHAFHRHCISEWLRRNAVCPLCHRRLPDEDEEEEDKQRGMIFEDG